MKANSRRRDFLKRAVLLGAAVPAVMKAAENAAGNKKPTVARTQELMRREPNKGLWNLHRSDTSRTNLVEMRGTSMPHIHPDAEHSLYVIEGDLQAVVAEETIELHAGDYISIPPGVRHGYIVPPGKRALLISMDAPPYDPAKTIRSPGK